MVLGGINVYDFATSNYYYTISASFRTTGSRKTVDLEASVIMRIVCNMNVYNYDIGR